MAINVRIDLPRLSGTIYLSDDSVSYSENHHSRRAWNDFNCKQHADRSSSVYSTVHSAQQDVFRAVLSTDTFLNEDTFPALTLLSLK
jgi:hypothetical protein